MARPIRQNLAASLAVAFVFCQPEHGWTQVLVIDADNKDQRLRDEQHSAFSAQKKASEVDRRTTIDCNIYQSEMYRRLNRSPAEIAKEEQNNIRLIKAAARKYHVPEGLALSVANAESGTSTCSGSPTGVKGVMQLTRKTGKAMGFNRGTNEGNIEGGVKYLSEVLHDKCRGDSYNYSCLAAGYNGSTRDQQLGWAAKTARSRAFWNAYAGNVPTGALGGSTGVDHGAGLNGRAAQEGAAASRGTDAAVAGSQDFISQVNKTIEEISQGVGQSERYQDAWDDNSRARTLTASTFNQLTNNAVAINNLLNASLMRDLQGKSTTARMTGSADNGASAVDPLSCDPVLLEKLNIPQNRWGACFRN